MKIYDETIADSDKKTIQIELMKSHKEFINRQQEKIRLKEEQKAHNKELKRIEKETVKAIIKSLDPNPPEKSRKSFSKAMRNRVWHDAFGDADGRCKMCSTKVNREYGWDVSHIISVKNGGSDHFDNLTVTCMGCNRSLGSINIPDFISKGGRVWAV